MPLCEPAVTRTEIEDLDRRQLLIGLVVLPLMACGKDAAEKGPAAATSAPTKRTIDTARGRVEIPVRPQRVVCVVNYAMNALFSLGVQPVGVPDGLGGSVLPAEAAVYQAAGKVGNWNAIDVEKVVALRPDLILGLENEWNAPHYDKLAAIAPTVLLPLAGTSDWENVTEKFAEAMGLTSELSALKTRYQARAASIRSAHSAALSATLWAIANEFQSGWVLWFPDSSGAQVLSGAGVRFSAAAAGRSGNYTQFSLEEIGRLADADVILVRSAGGRFSEGTQRFLDQPTVKSLKAARGGHIVPIANLFPMSYTQAIALLDELEAILRTL